LTADMSVIFLEKSSHTYEVPFWAHTTVISIVSLPIAFGMSFVIPSMQAVLGADESIWGPEMWWAAGDSPVAKGCLERTNMKCGSEAGGFWRGWDAGMIWVALTLGCLNAWAGGFIVQMLSATSKRLAKVVVFGGLYFLGDCLLLRRVEDAPISAVSALAAVQVMALTHAFFMLKKPKKKPCVKAEPSVGVADQRGSSASTTGSKGGQLDSSQTPGDQKGTTLLECLATSSGDKVAVASAEPRKSPSPEVPVPSSCDALAQSKQAEVGRV